MMTRTLWLIGAASLLLTACETANPAPVTYHDGPVEGDVLPSRTEWNRPGFEIMGADYRTFMAFEDRPDEPQVYLRHELEGSDPVEAWLNFASPWMADANQRFEGETAQGTPAYVKLEAGPCEIDARGGTYFAEVHLGSLVYTGCARETGPVALWIDDLDAALSDIGICESHLDRLQGVTPADLETRQVTYWSGEEGRGRVIYRMEDKGRVECRISGSRPDWSGLSENDSPQRGDSDPIFIPDRVPEQGEGCYLYERVRDEDGQLIGAFGHDACSG